MKTLIKLLPLLLMASLMTAQPPMPEKGPMPMMGKKMLNLDEAQQKELRQLRYDHEKATIRLHADIKVLRMELRELIAKQDSRKAIDKKQTQIDKQMSKLHSMKNDHLIKVRAIVGEDNFMMMGDRMKHHQKTSKKDCKKHFKFFNR